jgi:hypothetical protein
MCWNQAVSLNTFAFGIFGLTMIYFNNTYSKYKINEFKNPYAYLFALSFILMQLFEFILWRNLDNKKINNAVSTLGLLLLCSQPVASLLLLENIPLRNLLLAIYTVPTTIFFIYNIWKTKIHTTISPSGRLSWKWLFYGDNLVAHAFLMSFYLFFLLFSIFYNQYYIAFLVILFYFLIAYYFMKDGCAGSVWCVSVNIVIVYFVLKILILMPVSELFE